MAFSKAPPPRKSKHKRVIGLMMFLVLAGGVVSFVMFGGGPKEAEEEIVIVDLSLPPPPPPPPPPQEEEPLPEPEEEMDESTEIAEADAPEDVADTSDEIDLGIDAGDLAPGTGGSFTVSVPRIGGRRGGGGGGGGGLLGSDMDSPPTPVSKIQPNYPSSLLSKGIGGKVLVTCVVDENGKVVSTSIKKSSGNAELDKAAVNAVTKWKFKPAQKAGRNMRATCVVPFNFEVKKN
jgi:protein TonB